MITYIIISYVVMFAIGLTIYHTSDIDNLSWDIRDAIKMFVPMLILIAPVGLPLVIISVLLFGVGYMWFELINLIDRVLSWKL